MELTQFHLSILGLAILGFTIAFYIAVKKRTNRPLVCPLKSNCDNVIHSHHSHFLGIPVEYIGMLYYAFLALFHAVLIAYPSLVSPLSYFIGIVISTQAFLFSLYLIAIQAFVLKEWCTWCITSAFLCLSIFVASIVHVPMPLSELFGHFTRFATIFHLFAVTIGVGGATITDIFFFRFLKKFRITEEESELLKVLSNAIWFALGLLVMTGLLLFIPKADVLIHSGKFLTKMTAIAVLITNGFLLNIVIQPRLAHIVFNEEHTHHPGELHHIRKLAFALGGISITSWYFIFVLGALRGVTLPYMPLVCFYAFLLVCAVIGSQIFDYYFSRKKPEAN